MYFSITIDFYHIFSYIIVKLATKLATNLHARPYTRIMKKSRQYGTGSLFKNGRNWFVRFRFEGRRIAVKIIDPDTGKPPETKTHASRLASHQISEFLNDKNKFLQKSKNATIAEIEERYLESTKNEISPGWHYTLDRYINYRIIPYCGKNTAIKSIDAIWIGRFRDHLQQTGIDNSTTNRILGTLSKLLKYAARIGAIESLPYIARLPVPGREVGRRLSQAEIDWLFAAAEEVGIHAVLFVGFGRYCGARHSESLRIQWEWIDWDRKLVRLDRQKNETSMPLPLTSPMLELLNRIPKSSRIGVIIRNNDKPFKNGREFWNRVKKIAGVDPSIRYHDLRHTFSCEVFDRYGFAGKELTRHSGTEAYRKYLHFNREKLIAQASDELFGLPESSEPSESSEDLDG